MNRTYRLIWSIARRAWVVTHEHATARGKASSSSRRIRRSLALLFFWIVLPQAALANPAGGQVVHGAASITQSGNTLTVTTSANSIINWQSFSIGANETTRFNQPSAASAVLNRVLGSDPSQILGQLQSNGRVFLVNPAGILVGPGARIDVVSLVASTLNLSNEDFLAGRMNFVANAMAGSVINQGTITTGAGGTVVLVGAQVTNEGSILTPQGQTVLAAGETVRLSELGAPGLSVEITGTANTATNLGQIVADAGQIGVVGALVRSGGTISASSVEREGGRVFLRSRSIASLDGTLDASGITGGQVSVEAERISQHGTINAEGNGGNGGNIRLTASERIIQDASARLSVSANTEGQGGQILVEAGDRVFSSGTLVANGDQGGQIQVLAKDVLLLGAHIEANGTHGGGEVLIGGDYQGKNPAVRNSETVAINFSTDIQAKATESGNGGKVIVWSDRDTQFYGQINARGGAASGNGGFIEVSGKAFLSFGGHADAGAAHGRTGALLLDPKNIVIDSAGSSGWASLNLTDPNPAASNNFGGSTVVLPINGNVVVTSSGDDWGGTNTGAVYLYNSSTGALVSTLRGSTANDQVGFPGATSGVTALINGNYVVSSSYWNTGVATSAGAVTWGSGTIGVAGVVSAANSLVGSTTNDQVGSFGVTALTNGNYVVSSPSWDNGAVTGAGAVTWGSGTTGVTGVVSTANSLVGSTANDQVGLSGMTSGVTALTNGNYVVSSSNWDNGGVAGAGAVTWGSGRLEYRHQLGGHDGD